jgi:hypothetical protein
MVTVDEHTFDETLLYPGAWVLDAGCRGFNFALFCADDYQCNVTCVDAGKLDPPGHVRIEYFNEAIARGRDEVKFYDFGNGTASYTDACGPQPGECRVTTVKTFDPDQYQWELIKLDIEGGEYDYLMGLQEPPARQITVEFHEHTPARRGDEFMAFLFHKMSKWYDMTGAVKDSRHGCGMNYWDVLFTLRP